MSIGVCPNGSRNGPCASGPLDWGPAWTTIEAFLTWNSFPNRITNKRHGFIHILLFVLRSLDFAPSTVCAMAKAPLEGSQTMVRIPFEARDFPFKQTTSWG